jgi:hypothetical protein
MKFHCYERYVMLRVEIKLKCSVIGATLQTVLTSFDSFHLDYFIIWMIIFSRNFSKLTILFDYVENLPFRETDAYQGALTVANPGKLSVFHKLDYIT